MLLGSQGKHLLDIWMHDGTHQRLMIIGLASILMILDTAVVAVNAVRGKGAGTIPRNRKMTVHHAVCLQDLSPLQLRKDIGETATEILGVHLIQMFAYERIRRGFLILKKRHRIHDGASSGQTEGNF